MSRTRTHKSSTNMSNVVNCSSPRRQSIFPQAYTTLYESIRDENNGSKRPESSCVHSRCSIGLQSYGVRSEQGFFPDVCVYRDETDNRNATVYNNLLSDIVSNRSSAAITQLEDALYKQYASLTDRKDVINFVRELGDLPSLFKALDKYRYIDWQFGFEPFRRDIMALLQSTDQAMANAKAKMAGMSKPVKLSRRVVVPIEYQSELAFFPGDASTLVFSGVAIVRMKVEIFVQWPDITQSYNLERLRLDIEGWNLDPATIWEGIPFSWLVDWFIPIGKSLESISGTNFNPVVYLNGSISVKADGRVSSKARWRPYWNKVCGGTDGKFTYYSRKSYSTNFSSIRPKRPEFRVPIPDLSKVGIINDIFGSGSSISDAKKLRRR